MKNLIRLTIAVVITFGLIFCDSQDKKVAADAQTTKKGITAPERPSDADLMAFKVYHHVMYKVYYGKTGGWHK